MFERFTDRARRVVVLAQEEARVLNHVYIGTEHILLALLHEGEGTAALTLESMSVSLEAAREQVRQIVGEGQAAPLGDIPFAPRAKKVLELAFREAQQLGDAYIGTEHILLGLIREGQGVGAQVLQKLGASPNEVRQTVIQLLADYTGGGEAGLFAEPMPERSRTMPALGPRCPSCNLPLANALRYRRLVAEPADEDDPPMPVLMLFCARCGTILRSFRGVGGLPPPAESGEAFDVSED